MQEEGLFGRKRFRGFYWRGIRPSFPYVHWMIDEPNGLTDTTGATHEPLISNRPTEFDQPFADDALAQMRLLADHIGRAATLFKDNRFVNLTPLLKLAKQITRERFQSQFSEEKLKQADLDLACDFTHELNRFIFMPLNRVCFIERSSAGPICVLGIIDEGGWKGQAKLGDKTYWVAEVEWFQLPIENGKPVEGFLVGPFALWNTHEEVLRAKRTYDTIHQNMDRPFMAYVAHVLTTIPGLDHEKFGSIFGMGQFIYTLIGALVLSNDPQITNHIIQQVSHLTQAEEQKSAFRTTMRVMATLDGLLIFVKNLHDEHKDELAFVAILAFIARQADILQNEMEETNPILFRMAQHITHHLLPSIGIENGEVLVVELDKDGKEIQNRLNRAWDLIEKIVVNYHPAILRNKRSLPAST